MKKLPLYYNNQIVGYFDEIIYNDDNIIEYSKIFLFKTDSYELIIDEIKKSTYSSFDNNINKQHINNNNLYNFQLIDDYIILKLIKNE